MRPQGLASRLSERLRVAGKRLPLGAGYAATGAGPTIIGGSMGTGGHGGRRADHHHPRQGPGEVRHQDREDMESPESELHPDDPVGMAGDLYPKPSRG
jgi:hypothetical protein